MNISGETVLSWSAILFFLLFAAFLIGSSFEGEPISTHFDAVAIGLLIAGCAAGTLLGFLLFRREYQALYRKVVLGDWLWRWLAGLYTLVLIVLAKVYADHQIVAVTWLPPSWFPRSQEILTGAYFICWFLISF
jgi:hypothetical protein